jgi:hypothetical protein
MRQNGKMRTGCISQTRESTGMSPSASNPDDPRPL